MDPQTSQAGASACSSLPCWLSGSETIARRRALALGVGAPTSGACRWELWASRSVSSESVGVVEGLGGVEVHARAVAVAFLAIRAGAAGLAAPAADSGRPFVVSTH